MSKQNWRTLLVLLTATVMGWGCATRGGISQTFATPSSASDQWRRVEGLAPGVLVSGVLRSGEEFGGTLTAVDSDGLTLSSTLERSQIRTVRVRDERKGRSKATLIGAAVGAAAGIALGAVVSEQIDVATRITMPVLGATGAGGGALVGYVLGRSNNRWRLVYDVN